MTEPRRKEWLFDVDKFWELQDDADESGLEDDYGVEYDKAIDKIEGFIQSEIERNRKDAVREFASSIRVDKVAQDLSEDEMLTQGDEGYNDCCDEWNEKIDVALKDRGIE